jgi:hypothetical protein
MLLELPQVDHISERGRLALPIPRSVIIRLPCQTEERVYAPIVCTIWSIGIVSSSVVRVKANLSSGFQVLSSRLAAGGKELTRHGLCAFPVLVVALGRKNKP